MFETVLNWLIRCGIGLLVILLVASGSVHFFDREFSGLLTRANAKAYKADLGEKVYEKYQCALCHGKDGAAPITPEYPTLAGQNKVYLEEQLLLIRDGIRSSGASPIMRESMKNLSDEEANYVAVFFAAKNGM